MPGDWRACELRRSGPRAASRRQQATRGDARHVNAAEGEGDPVRLVRAHVERRRGVVDGHLEECARRRRRRGRKDEGAGREGRGERGRGRDGRQGRAENGRECAGGRRGAAGCCCWDRGQAERRVTRQGELLAGAHQPDPARRAPEKSQRGSLRPHAADFGHPPVVPQQPTHSLTPAWSSPSPRRPPGTPSASAGHPTNLPRPPPPPGARPPSRRPLRRPPRSAGRPPPPPAARRPNASGRCRPTPTRAPTTTTTAARARCTSSDAAVRLGGASAGADRLLVDGSSSSRTERSQFQHRRRTRLPLPSAFPRPTNQTLSLYPLSPQAPLDALQA